jgi:hypothetical protein
VIQHKHARLLTSQISPNKNKKNKYNKTKKSIKVNRKKIGIKKSKEIIVKTILRILNAQKSDRFQKFQVDFLTNWAFIIYQMVHSMTLMGTFLISMVLMSLGAVTIRTITTFQVKKINTFFIRELIKNIINKTKKAINTTKMIRKIPKDK